MFSWSSTKQYPGTRRTPANPNVVAQPVQGTIRPPEHTRAKHLESFLGDSVLKRSTRRVSRDDTTYDTVFQTTNGHTLIVRIHMPVVSTATSPCKAPGMTLAGVRAKHPWLDSRMRITGYAPIQTDEAWRSKGILLGAAVHEVVKHLQLNAPKVVEITDPGLRSIQPKAQGNNSTPPSSGRSSLAQQDKPTAVSENGDDAPPNYETLLNFPGVELPQIPASFDCLNSLSRDDLEKLLEDEIQFMSFVNKLPVMEKILEVRCSLLDKNAGNAMANLDKEKELKKLHQEVTLLQKELKVGIQNFQNLEKMQDSLCAPPDTRSVLKQLTKAKKEALDSSEDMAEEWLEDGGDPDQFVKTFVQQRMNHHIQASKIELIQCQNRR